MTFTHVLRAICLCALVTGVASAAVSVTVVPPVGWARENVPKAVVGGYHEISEWLSFARGDEEYVGLRSRPSFGFSAEDYGRFVVRYLGRAQAPVYASHVQSLCRDERGWYLKYQQPHEPNLRVEEVFVVNGSTIYAARYVYPSSLAPIVAAQRAVTSLCAHGALAAVTMLPVTFAAPKGWILSNAAASGPHWPGLLGTYLDTNDYYSVIFLEIERDKNDGAQTPGTQTPDARTPAERSMDRKKKVVDALTASSTEPTPLCNGGEGFMITFTGTYGGHKVAGLEMLYPGNPSYGAVYMHPLNSPENPAVRDALKTLCPTATNTGQSS